MHTLYLVVPLFVTLLGADVKFLVIVAGVYTVQLVDVLETKLFNNT